MTRSTQEEKKKSRDDCGQPRLPPFLQQSLLHSIDAAFIITTIKRPWESVRGMAIWRDEGEEGSGAAGSSEACVWVGSFLEVSFCPSWSPVFIRSHAASCTIPQLWVTGLGVRARQQGQILHRRGLTLCLFVSLSLESSWILHPVFGLDFLLF